MTWLSRLNGWVLQAEYRQTNPIKLRGTLGISHVSPVRQDDAFEISGLFSSKIPENSQVKKATYSSGTRFFRSFVFVDIVSTSTELG